MSTITPSQALDNLHKAAEAVPCDGPNRDILRDSTKVLQDFIAQVAKAAQPTVQPPAQDNPVIAH